MSFLSTLQQVLAKKTPKKKAKVNKADIADRLDVTRAELVDALGRDLDVNSPRFRSILNKWRSHWFDLYEFTLRPEQEKKYLEVLKDRSE